MNTITDVANEAILKVLAVSGSSIASFQIQIANFQLGANNTTFDPAATTMPGGSVYIGGAGELTFLTTSDPNTICYIVTLDSSIGTFTYGSVGLYLSTGELFTYITLPEIRTKTAEDLPTQAGDVHIYYIPVSVASTSKVFANIDIEPFPLSSLPASTLASLLTSGGANSPLALALASLIPQLPTAAVSGGPTLHTHDGSIQYT